MQALPLGDPRLHPSQGRHHEPEFSSFHFVLSPPRMGSAGASRRRTTVGDLHAAAKNGAGSLLANGSDRTAYGDGLLVLLPFWHRLPKPMYQSGDWKWLLGLGVLQPCLYFILEVKALQFTSSGQAGTVAALAPLFVALLAWIWLKERMGRNGILGLLLSLTGVVLLSLGARHEQSAPNPLLGNSLQLLAMLCIALYGDPQTAEQSLRYLVVDRQPESTWCALFSTRCNQCSGGRADLCSARSLV